MPISEQLTDSAEDFARKLRSVGIRGTVADRETLSYRIRNAELSKIPYMVVLGDREIDSGTVAVRKRGIRVEENWESDEFVDRLLKEIDDKVLD